MTRRYACFGAGTVAIVLALAGTGLARAQDPPAAATAAGSPAVERFYVEIPSAGNAIANALMGPVIGSSNAVKQMERLMAFGETAQLEVVAYGDNERTVLKSVEAALKSFQGKRLPNLTLGVVTSADNLEKLRPLAEPLGVRLVVREPLK